MVLKAGQLEEKAAELKHEVYTINTSVAKLQMELMSMTGGRHGKPANPWQVGVPYGSKATRTTGGGRDEVWQTFGGWYGRWRGREEMK